MAVQFERYRFVGFDNPRALLADATVALEVVDSGLPGIERVCDALFVPPSSGSQPSGWLFQADGSPIEAAVHRRAAEVVSGDRAPDPLPDPVATIEDEVLYLGQFFRHFGHMMLEGLARCWALPERGTSRLLIHGLSHYPRLPSHRALFEGLGVEPELLIYPSGPVRLRSVTVPRPALVYGGVVYRQLRHTYHSVLARLGVDGGEETEQPLYLSRAGLDRSARRALGEVELERVLAANGFRIFSPERHDLREQLAVVHRHRNLFGFWGSAFRLAYFSPRKKLCCCLVEDFPWPSVLADVWITDADAWFVKAAERDRQLGPGDAWRSLSHVRFDAVLDLLRSEGFVRGPTQRPRGVPDESARTEAAYVHAHELARTRDDAGLAAFASQLEGPAELAALQVAVGTVALERGDHVAAESAARAALELMPGDAHAHSVLGRATTGAEAVASLCVALTARPDDVEAALALTGIPSTETEVETEVERVLHLALAARPDHVPLRLRLAALLEAAGRVREAFALLRRRLPAAARDAQIRCALGSLLARHGKPARAERYLREAVCLDPGDAALLGQLALLLAATGRGEEAVECARRAVEREPVSTGYHAIHGIALAAAGRPAEAEATLRAALTRDPDHADSQKILAGLLARRAGGLRGWLRRIARVIVGHAGWRGRSRSPRPPRSDRR